MTMTDVTTLPPVDLVEVDPDPEQDPAESPHCPADDVEDDL